MKQFLLPLIVAAFAMFSVPAFSAQAPDGVGTREITATMPTQNTDGTSVTDLDVFTIYWGFSPRGYTDSASVPAAPPGGQITDTVTVNVTGDYGDIVNVYFAGTVTDLRGNESAFSNEIMEPFEIVDQSTPNPPSIQFTVPIGYNCTTPDGERCYLRRVSAG